MHEYSSIEYISSMQSSYLIELFFIYQKKNLSYSTYDGYYYI